MAGVRRSAIGASLAMIGLPKTLLLLGSLESKTSAPEAELDFARWLQVFDRESTTEPVCVVGGAVLRLLVPGGRPPRDLDVQHAGSPEEAAHLQGRLRSAGIPANVRSLQTPGTRNVMTMAAGWRRTRGRLGHSSTVLFLFASIYGPSRSLSPSETTHGTERA